MICHPLQVISIHYKSRIATAIRVILMYTAQSGCLTWYINPLTKHLPQNILAIRGEFIDLKIA